MQAMEICLVSLVLVLEIEFRGEVLPTLFPDSPLTSLGIVSTYPNALI